MKSSKDMLMEHKRDLMIAEKQRKCGIELGQNVSKLKNRCKVLRNIIGNLERNGPEINKLEERKYYIVRIKYNHANIEHGAILYTESDDFQVSIYNHSYEKVTMNVKHMNMFKVIREIEELNESWI